EGGLPVLQLVHRATKLLVGPAPEVDRPLRVTDEDGQLLAGRDRLTLVLVAAAPGAGWTAGAGSLTIQPARDGGGVDDRGRVAELYRSRADGGLAEAAPQRAEAPPLRLRVLSARRLPPPGRARRPGAEGGPAPRRRPGQRDRPARRSPVGREGRIGGLEEPGPACVLRRAAREQPTGPPTGHLPGRGRGSPGRGQRNGGARPGRRRPGL